MSCLTRSKPNRVIQAFVFPVFNRNAAELLLNYRFGVKTVYGCYWYKCNNSRELATENGLVKVHCIDYNRKNPAPNCSATILFDPDVLANIHLYCFKYVPAEISFGAHVGNCDRTQIPHQSFSYELSPGLFEDNDAEYMNFVSMMHFHSQRTQIHRNENWIHKL